MASRKETESSAEVKLLMSRYREAPVDGPEAKRVKFSEVYDGLSQTFHQNRYNSYLVSKAIYDAFPRSLSKKGVEEKPPEECDTVTRLQQRVRELEARVENVYRTLFQSLSSQLQGVIDSRYQIFHGPDTIEHFHSSIDTMIAEVCEKAPDVLQLISSLGKGDLSKPSLERCDIESLMSLCALVKGRSSKTVGIQLLMSLMLIARSTSKQAMNVLNHAGVCLSYTGAWNYLRKLTTEARFLELVVNGHWLWVYDNLNIHQTIRHEREDVHSKMLNITARLAVKIHNLPNWEVDWSDVLPQCSRSSLNISHFLPSKDEANQLQRRATEYLMHLMVEEFPSLTDLRGFVPPHTSLHPVEASQVVPMKVLFKKEKYIAETIDILNQLMIDAALDGNPQVVVGDQLTCKNIRGARLWRQSEIQRKDTLSWANPTAGDFHFLWECLRNAFLILWGNPSFTGSLSNLREYIERRQVSKGVKVFNVGDEFLMHSFKAHLIAAICKNFDIKDASEPIIHDITSEWLRSTAE